MLDYALDLADLKTLSWFRSAMDQGSHPKVQRKSIMATHKITGLSMIRLPNSQHVAGGMPTLGFLVRSQLDSFRLQPGHSTQVRDRAGNQVSDYNWQQKNLRPRLSDEKSIYVLNDDEVEGMVEAGGYDDQHQFLRSMRRELTDQVYERPTILQMTSFEMSGEHPRRMLGVQKGKHKKPAPIKFTGVSTSEVCPKFSQRVTDNSFTYTIADAFDRIAEQLQSQKTRQAQPADVKMVTDQPQLLTNYVARTPEKLAANAYSPDYQRKEAERSGVSPKMVEQMHQALQQDTEKFASGKGNPYETNSFASTHPSSAASASFKTGIQNSRKDKRISTKPLSLRSQLNLGSSAIKAEIREANGKEVRDRHKKIRTKPLHMRDEINLRNNVITYNDEDEDEDDDEDEAVTSSASSMESSIADDEDSESSQRSSNRSKAASAVDDEESESSQNSSLAEEADDDEDSSDDAVKNSNINQNYIRSKSIASSEAESEANSPTHGGFGLNN